MGAIAVFLGMWIWVVLIILIIVVGFMLCARLHSAAKDSIYENAVNSYLSDSRKKKTAVSGRYRKMDGYTYESHVAKRLRAMGYRDVEITAKSGDFGADIIARDWKGSKICFQCKRYSGPVGVKSVQEAISARGFYKCKRAAVITPSVFTKGAKRLAKSSHIKLYEGFK